jgi:hypothetical protein
MRTRLNCQRRCVGGHWSGGVLEFGELRRKSENRIGDKVWLHVAKMEVHWSLMKHVKVEVR